MAETLQAGYAMGERPQVYRGGMALRRGFDSLDNGLLGQQLSQAVRRIRSILDEPSLIEIMASNGDLIAAEVLKGKIVPIQPVAVKRTLDPQERAARITDALSHMHPAEEQIALIDPRKNIMERFWTAPLGDLRVTFTQN